MKMMSLHGELEEQIYMKQPKGFKQHGKENVVCKLKMSLYRLKQSLRQRYQRFDSFMLRIGYMQSMTRVYFRVLDDNSFILLMLYVDNVLIAAKNIKDINDLKSKLYEEFDMKDLGIAKRILGMEIFRSRKASKLWITQKTYIEK